MCSVSKQANSPPATQQFSLDRWTFQGKSTIHDLGASSVFDASPYLTVPDDSAPQTDSNNTAAAASLTTNLNSTETGTKTTQNAQATKPSCVYAREPD